jgi:hypothetical protein
MSCQWAKAGDAIFPHLWVSSFGKGRPTRRFSGRGQAVPLNFIGYVMRPLIAAIYLNPLYFVDIIMIF